MKVPSTEDLHSTLLLNRIFAGSSRRAAALIAEGFSSQHLLERIESENLFDKRAMLAEVRQSFSAVKELETCARLGIRCLTLSGLDYPPMLREIIDPPLVLYIKGTVEISDGAALAVVGSRHPSYYGLTQAKKFGRGLAEAGLTVLSGLAQGIDQAAHEGALEIPYGRTIAVMGSGLDVLYPKNAGRIYERICERGAVLSEYPLGTPPLAHHFPTRNRIIAGLSLGVLVVEAHLRSGSLITAREALEQGREVFAIPGPVDQLTSRGAHRLIREGAALVESPEEIVELMAPVLGSHRTSPASDPEEKGEPIEKITVYRTTPAAHDNEAGLVLQSLAGGPLGLVELAESSGLTPAFTADIMTRLELGGRVKRAPDGRFSLHI